MADFFTLIFIFFLSLFDSNIKESYTKHIFNLNIMAVDKIYPSNGNFHSRDF